MHLLLTIGLAFLVASLGPAAPPPDAPPEEIALPEAPPSAAGPRVQLALLLDTSSSMSGLIDQARTQLWKVVNELSASRKDGRIPQIEVALYEYGKSSLTAEDGWIRQITGFTTDLDRVSELLFALSTSGGEEYCGQVIERALSDLAWAEDPGAYKVIYIAGNEPFSQGPVDWRGAVKSAVQRGITVNTIHCGTEEVGAASGWSDGALLADGQFLAIDQNRAVAHIEAPQDADLARLGAAMNQTYLPFGQLGIESVARQSAQDHNASTGVGSAVQRSVFKASANYLNDAWDLVDALAADRVKLEDIEPAALPEGMRQMSLEQRRSHVAAMSARRVELRAQVQTLNQARNAYVAGERRRLAAEGGAETLDQAMIRSLRTQASRAGFDFQAPQ